MPLAHERARCAKPHDAEKADRGSFDVAFELGSLAHQRTRRSPQ